MRYSDSPISFITFTQLASLVLFLLHFLYLIFTHFHYDLDLSCNRGLVNLSAPTVHSNPLYYLLSD